MPTPNYGLPNDLHLSSPNNPPEHINALADAVDTALAQVNTSAQNTNLSAGLSEIYSTYAAKTAVTVSRHGRVVTISGYFELSSGAIGTGIVNNVARVPAFARTTGIVTIPCISWINGSENPYRSTANLTIDQNGYIDLKTEIACTQIHVNGSYLV